MTTAVSKPPVRRSFFVIASLLLSLPGFCHAQEDELRWNPTWPPFETSAILNWQPMQLPQEESILIFELGGNVIVDEPISSRSMSVSGFLIMDPTGQIELSEDFSVLSTLVILESGSVEAGGDLLLDDDITILSNVVFSSTNVLQDSDSALSLNSGSALNSSGSFEAFGSTNLDEGSSVISLGVFQLGDSNPAECALQDASSLQAESILMINGSLTVNDFSTLNAGNNIIIGESDSFAELSATASDVSAECLSIVDGRFTADSSTVELTKMETTTCEGEVLSINSDLNASQIKLRGGSDSSNDDDYSIMTVAAASDVETDALEVGASPQQFPGNHLAAIEIAGNSVVSAEVTTLQEGSILAITGGSQLTTGVLNLDTTQDFDNAFGFGSPMVLSGGILEVTDSVNVEDGVLRILSELGDALFRMTGALADVESVVVETSTFSSVLEVSDASGILTDSVSVGPNDSGGIIEINNSLLLADVGITVGGFGQITQNSGQVISPRLTLIEESFYSFNDGDLMVNEIVFGDLGFSTFVFSGGVLQFDSMNSDLTQNGGQLSPGVNQNTAVILGDYTQNSGVLGINFDNGGTPEDLFVLGTATLNSVVDIDLVNYVPTKPKTFQILQAATFSGNPTIDLDGAQLPEPFEWDTSNLMIDGTISITSDSLLGDVNLDGVVNLLDVAPFVDLLTGGEFQFEADINQDGAVNLLDVGPFVELIAG